MSSRLTDEQLRADIVVAFAEGERAAAERIVAWLREEEARHRSTSRDAGTWMERDAASVAAATLHNVAGELERGEHES